MNFFSVWAGDIHDDFIIFGTLKKNMLERRVKSSRKAPSSTRLVKLDEYVNDSMFITCKTLFLSCLDMDGFLTPSNTPVLKSDLTVYQEAGFGTCWYCGTP